MVSCLRFVNIWGLLLLTFIVLSSNPFANAAEKVDGMMVQENRRSLEAKLDDYPNPGPNPGHSPPHGSSSISGSVKAYLPPKQRT